MIEPTSVVKEECEYVEADDLVLQFPERILARRFHDFS